MLSTAQSVNGDTHVVNVIDRDKTKRAVWFDILNFSTVPIISFEHTELVNT
jgi:hypothetical protein